MNEREHNLDRQDNRLFLDIVKGVAIFLMLWGHCIQYCTNGEFDFLWDPVFKFIYTFHMPLFMLVSGYLFFFSCQKRNLKELLVHRAQAMLQPILLCGAFNFFITTAVYERNLYYFISGGWIKHLDSLWFLWSVLAASIVLGIATKATNNRILKVVIIIVGAGFVCLFPNWSQNLIMYPYFLLGFFFARYKDNLPKNVLRLKYFALIIFPALLIVYYHGGITFTNEFIITEQILKSIMINLWELALGISGSVFVLVILELLYKFIFIKKAIVLKPLSNLGKKSLQVYCISVSVLSFWLPRLFSKLCTLIGRNVFASHLWFYDLVFTPVLAIVYAVLIYYFIKLLEKIKVSKLLFGR